jgi:hypothetical protein
MPKSKKKGLLWMKVEVDKFVTVERNMAWRKIHSGQFVLLVWHDPIGHVCQVEEFNSTLSSNGWSLTS